MCPGDLLERGARQVLSAEEVLELYRARGTESRVLLLLLQQPRFPLGEALGALNHLELMDLIRLIRAPRVHPAVREKGMAILETRWERLGKGERKALGRILPFRFLGRLRNEKDPDVVDDILRNPQCTEELLLGILQQSLDPWAWLVALGGTDWVLRPTLARWLMAEKRTPVRTAIAALPALGRRELEHLLREGDQHPAVLREAGRLLELPD